MINKEEIEKQIYSFNKYMSNQTEDEIMQNYWENIAQYISELEKENNVFKQANIDNSKIISCIDKENYKLNNRIKDLEKELENYKNIVAGKTIREMGVSNLYGGGSTDEHQ